MFLVPRLLQRHFITRQARSWDRHQLYLHLLSVETPGVLALSMPAQSRVCLLRSSVSAYKIVLLRYNYLLCHEAHSQRV